MVKVFQIFVPDYTLVSRIISSENLVTELYVIDRNDKKFVQDNTEALSKPALYILINRDTKQLYVGETDDCFKRLRNHEAKDFWTEAIVFHSKGETLSTTEVKWLEAKTYEVLKELGYYDMSENKQIPQKPPLKQYQIYTLETNFAEAKNYICAAGFDIFMKKKTEKEEQTIPDKPTKPDESSSNNVWLIPASRKLFDLDACFAEYGEVYWKVTNNLKHISEGDRGYIYCSAPDKAILYRFDVIKSSMPYSKQMDRDEKFSNDNSNTNKEFGNKGGLFALFRMSGVIKDERLSLPMLLNNGLNGAPQASIRLSQDKYRQLLNFVDTNFDTVPTNANNEKKNRRAPFKFSMIGLKPGNTITFAPRNINVKIISDNTIEYNNKDYTLSRFCKNFMPVKNSKNKEYQGPAHFTYKGKTLDKIRKEFE